MTYTKGAALLMTFLYCSQLLLAQEYSIEPSSLVKAINVYENVEIKVREINQLVYIDSTGVFESRNQGLSDPLNVVFEYISYAVKNDFEKMKEISSSSNISVIERYDEEEVYGRAASFYGDKEIFVTHRFDVDAYNLVSFRVVIELGPDMEMGINMDAVYENGRWLYSDNNFEEIGSVLVSEYPYSDSLYRVVRRALDQ